MHRSLAHILLVGVVGLTACKRKIEEPAPMGTGSYLTYKIVEQLPGTNLTTQVTLKFTKQDDTLALSISGEKGQSSAKLDLEGRPLEGTIEVPLHSGQMLELVSVWMPTKDRKPGTVMPAGRILKKRPYLDWEVWEVISRTKGQGARYFEANTGILVGWQFRDGPKEIVGKLIDSQ